MKTLLLLGGLVAASLTAAQAVLPKQQSAAQRDSVVTDSIWGSGAYSSQHSSPYRRNFEIPPGVPRPTLGVRHVIKPRTKKAGTP
jgi:hypothetical protein